ncbi:DNA mismatch repair protein MutS [Aurantibacter sp.]|uniref:MutS-related protein n=1 Tax=Aurantibacter sp. TaxID=2807103 RepID=UPI0035C7E571
MSPSLTYYQNNLITLKVKLSKNKKDLLALSLTRLMVFLATCLGLYFTYKTITIAIGIGCVGLIVFLYLLHKYTTLKTIRNYNKALLTINNNEIRQSTGDFLYKEQGLEFQDPKHEYCLDIDLFGRGSFFQNLDRSQTLEGKTYLADLLKANQISNIEIRQEGIKELADKTKFRQHYQATASLIKAEVKIATILKWLTTYKPFLPKYSVGFAYGFSIVSLMLLALTIFKILSAAYFGYWLFVGLALSGRFVKKISALSEHTSKIKDTFKQYATLLDAIENETFSSKALIEKQDLINSEEEKASEIFKTFSKHLDALDNRNNLIGAIFGNGYFLLDIKNAFLIEKWIKQHKSIVENWFSVISFFDAYQSFGTYVFNNQDLVFPKISNQNNTIKATNLGHPLLHKEKRICSDVLIENNQFFIVTGANMAGKSTFLRTISLHIVMANVGLPVCATESSYGPTKLITSMRTTDNLTDDSSYFFSELTRLKFIVDSIKNECYFIILDEILKGTNSKDKAEGSKKFVKKLVSSNANGIIATHDLSLCEIEAELPEVKNYYFDAFIENDELSFDYKFKKGVCQNMNASFLLKKMDIV